MRLRLRLRLRLHLLNDIVISGALTAITAISMVSSACGPSYVQPVSYDYNSGYYQPYYQPGLTIIVDPLGRRGYYDSYHRFYPVITLNGSMGYYDSSHRFVSSSPAVREAYISHRPFYAGPAASRVGSAGVAPGQRSLSNPQGLNGSVGRNGGVPSPSYSVPQPSRPTTGTSSRSYVAPTPGPRPSGLSSGSSSGNSSRSSSRSSRR